jgi:hypothetical protein
MDLALVLEEAKRYTMYRRIAPPLVKEASGAVQMIEVIAVLLTSPKGQVPNLEVRPEVTGRVPMRFLEIVRSPLSILQPVPRIVLVHILRMILDEFLRFRPKCLHRFRGVVDVDVEPIRLVVVLHPRENVVVDVAEEVDVGLDAPVVLVLGQRGVFAEHARVPAAHLVVGELVHVLDFVREEGDGFAVQVHVDPGGDCPVVLGNEFCKVIWSVLPSCFDQDGRVCGERFGVHTKAHLGLGRRFRLLLELFCERHIVEKGPRVVELVIPRPF